ncbi:similar to Saccharomyces cerevisiae YKR071C DRE2 Conserved component of an early step in the cytosolic Fe-S protein assembly (CIA) machinery [Maudiozyma barnettii]|uniref:Similar to Saccharomyces cerevisiae YKR071C DRE2 Conserved component of an early step in the cytosolic Fe-S protein assembly (CIA) machinery n=1 Tax=Maudiozyma barnettii TaxID=61262 RepID=A0A8H2VIG4_9SACH|nr:electron carrier DRE2 [Kazachstania barnettii]CAB4256026.1 similar to Saccharomyces cerevisiae YKR071C DRE2 Conserved component of an early step in the cytosolic Fe-S protein assembly (CIA) machinery [Kazachstania barnettii]CAD1784634.1 similar to Saccharomyces cerevisiae YKR071C DRE2 Conserved component of an early step in the cytosolic Fe-S protein assembly (CIA) machinery [Kazachstania barnettii]
MSTTKIGLLLIHPAVTTTPELVQDVKEGSTERGIKFVDQYLVNKVNDSSIKLKPSTYDVIHYLTPEKSDAILFPKKLIPVLQASMKPNGNFYGLSDIYKVDALINGFDIVNDSNDLYHWVNKANIDKPVSKLVSLKSTDSSNSSSSLPSFKKSVNSGKVLPSFKKLPTFQKKSDGPQIVKLADDNDELDEDMDEEVFSDFSKTQFFDEMDDEDSIEEDNLISEKGQNNVITMITCGKTKTSRKKACKDCSCGIKEEEEQEIDNIRSQQEKVVQFTEDELTEIDFTIEGKKVGGCGSCSLGDAFRCSGCPYLGLPAFKPGEKINLTSISDDL